MLRIRIRIIFGSRIRSRICVKSRIRILPNVRRCIRILIKVKIQELWRFILGPSTLTLEAWRLEMEPLRVYRPVIAGLHHSDEAQDPDPSGSRTEQKKKKQPE
jgi:hypothetical protein